MIKKTLCPKSVDSGKIEYTKRITYGQGEPKLIADCRGAALVIQCEVEVEPVSRGYVEQAFSNQ